jgi:RNA chaperone Hfq
MAAPHLTDRTLQEYKVQQTVASVFLVSGIKISGQVLDFDQESVMISSERSSKGVLVMRSAITTIMPDVVVQDKAHSKGGARGKE